MKAEEIEKVLKNIPNNLADVHPIEIHNYLNSKFHDGLSANDKNLIIANYVIRNVPQEQKIKPWHLLEIYIKNKFGASPDFDMDELYPWLRLAHAQGSSDLVITRVQTKN